MQPESTSVTVAPSSHTAGPVSPETTVYPAFQPKAGQFLGITQLITGPFCILIQITAINARAPLYFAGIGIWAGILFVVTGVYSILASKTKSRCRVITLMVVSIISAVLAGGMVINQSFAVAIGNNHHIFPHHETTMNWMLLVAAIIEMIAAITQAALCHRAIYHSYQSVPATQVLYVNQPPVAQSNVVNTQGIPQNQLQPALVPQLFIFTQGQFMPVVALPQGSVTPTMVAGQGYQISPAPMSGAVNPVHQIQVQPQPQPETYPQSMQDNEKNEAQMTPAQPSPPPAYTSNPDLQQPQANVEDVAKTDAGQTSQSRGQWEKF